MQIITISVINDFEFIYFSTRYFYQIFRAPDLLNG